MVEPTTRRQPPRLTARGVATRNRILFAAADLIHVKGVNATTLDEICVASGTSKSQLYHHFLDKDTLIRAVAALQAERVLDRERALLGRLNSFTGLRRWRDSMVELNRVDNGAYGCALASLANEVADRDEVARTTVAASLASWEALLADGLRRMQDRGRLNAAADPGRLATGLFAALQGGYLLSKAFRDVHPMEVALDMALACVEEMREPAGGRA